VLENCDATGLVSAPGQAGKGMRIHPWSIAAGGDLANPKVEGKRTLAMMRLVERYLQRLLLASAEDTQLSLAFQRVTNLMDPPSALFQPQIVKRVLFAKRQQTAPD